MVGRAVQSLDARAAYSANRFMAREMLGSYRFHVELYYTGNGYHEDHHWNQE